MAKKDPHVHRPNPTLTASEAMAQTDARNMLSLVRDLTTYMPPPYKEQLLRDGHFYVKLGKYQVQITISGRFEQATEESGKVNW